VASEPHELIPPGAHDLLQRALDNARGDPEVLCDLLTAKAVAVQRCDRSLSLRQRLQDGARHALNLGLVLASDQLVDRATPRAVNRF
jgi:hypothetical protein